MGAELLLLLSRHLPFAICRHRRWEKYRAGAGDQLVVEMKSSRFLLCHVL